MKILKTLDRAVAITMSVTVGVPTLSLGGILIGITEAIADRQPEHRRDAEEASRILSSVLRMLVRSMCATVEYGYFGSFTNPEARKRAARQAAELIADMQGLTEEQKAGLVEKTGSIIDEHIAAGRTTGEVLSQDLQNLLRNYMTPTTIETILGSRTTFVS